MPQITINEVDTSTSGGLVTTTNAVYVPGFAIMGPVNTPVLCNSVDEFEKIFGSTPYYFEKDQENWTGLTWGSADFKPIDEVVRAGTAEKSYIYAHELLELGLPVLYERVFSTAKAPLFTSVAIVEADSTEDVIKFTSSSVGKESFFICGKLEKLAYGETCYYNLTTWRLASEELHTDAIDKATLRFTFDYTLSQNSNIAYYLDVQEDANGLFTIDWDGIVSSNPNFIELDDEIENPINFYLNSRIDNNSDLEEVLHYEFNAETGAIESATFVADAFVVDGVEVFAFDIVDIYNAFRGDSTSTPKVPSSFEKLVDKGEYVIKFITSGAYPSLGEEFGAVEEFSVANTMVRVAGVRGDVTALIDLFYDKLTALQAHAEVSKFVKSGQVDTVDSEYGSERLYKYGATIFPYGVFRNSVVSKNVVMPGSFAYLSALAVSVKSNPNYLAIAGVKRGVAQRLLKLCTDVSNAEAQAVQEDAGVSINPITNIKPYGLILWGNRTLYDSTLDGGTKASSFLNVRQLANDIKRTLFVSSRELTFEQNNDILWINFKSKLVPLLNQMVSNGGISGYELKRVATVKKATLKARIKVYAIEAVENFDLLLDLSDNILTLAE